MGEKPIEVTVADIVDAARENPNAPAAEVYRLAQARKLIEMVRLYVEEGKGDAE